MKTTASEYGVRAQGAGRLASVGWKRPLTKQQAWEQAKRFQADAGYTMIEIIDFSVTDPVWIWTR